jgi:uroporphyrinogen-III synthase
MVPTGAPPPVQASAVLVSSPAAARHALLPPGLPLLVPGQGTASLLAGRQVLVSADPSAEGLWEFLRAAFPEGGDFLLARGRRSRGFLEEASRGTRWTLHAWITHEERAADPLPVLPALEAFLALSPLQGETFASLGPDLPCFAWGRRTARALEAHGRTPEAWCDPRPQALERMLVGSGKGAPSAS